ncbi:MAG TPA: alpha/beta hydrolase [Hyphomicrobiaceae bacterium]|nr:alpha/beta hydrolase [Hyphomicrobiaceae bacterium]
MLPLAAFTTHPSLFSLFGLVVGDGGARVEQGITYGPDARHLLDIWRPRRAPDAGPVVVYFYGGGWTSGCRAGYGFVGGAIASIGATCVIPDYRLYPKVRWPVFQEDAAAAVAWVARNVPGIERRPLVLMGHSAGAHLAAMLALDPRWLRAAGANRPVDGLIGLSGPYWFEPTTWPTTAHIFADATSKDEPRPVFHAGPHAPPALLVHGEADDLVKPHNTHELAAALEAAGRPVTKLVVPGAGHRKTLLGIARPVRWRTDARGPIAEFLRGIDGNGITSLHATDAR